MSVHVTAAVWAMTVGDPEAKLVLLKLADNANDDGIAWPSQRTLAKECEVSQPTISRRVNYLVEKGFLAIEKAGNPHRSTVYRVRFTSESMSQRDESKRFTQVNTSDSAKVNQNHQEPSMNHQRSCTHKVCEGLGHCSYDEVDAVSMPKVRERSAA